MNEYLNGLSNSLEYMSHEHIGDDAIIITCRVKRGGAVCPYCGRESGKANCRYKRKLKDLPFGDKKVTLIVWFNNYFCANSECSHKTFAESVDFVSPFSVRTKRLDGQIITFASNGSGIGTERCMKRNYANVSDTTINRILKKNRLAR